MVRTVFCTVLAFFQMSLLFEHSPTYIGNLISRPGPFDLLPTRSWSRDVASGCTRAPWRTRTSRCVCDHAATPAEGGRGDAHTVAWQQTFSQAPLHHRQCIGHSAAVRGRWDAYDSPYTCARAMRRNTLQSAPQSDANLLSLSLSISSPPAPSLFISRSLGCSSPSTMSARCRSQRLCRRSRSGPCSGHR